MAGSELPVHPIGIIESEIRRELEIGQSFVESGLMPENNRRKVEVKHVLQRRRNFRFHPGYELIPVPQQGILKDPAPHNLTVFKAEPYEMTDKCLMNNINLFVTFIFELYKSLI